MIDGWPYAALRREDGRWLMTVRHGDAEGDRTEYDLCDAAESLSRALRWASEIDALKEESLR